MAVIKFDQQKTKQQLLHVSISLATILICMSYMQRNKNWTKVGRFWESLIVPFLFAGEILKVLLAKYYARNEKDTITHKQKRRNFFTVWEIVCGLLMQFVCMMLYGFICILLGAPLLQDYEQTFVLALILTLLTVSPTVFLIGAGGALQVCFCEKVELILKTEEICVNLFKYNAAGAIFGAWAGSVVAPLDWDRDWQLYPIPNIFGALLGCGLANIFACSKVLYTTARVYFAKKRA